MELSDYPCESLSFSGLGAEGKTAAAAAEALAESLNEWVSSHAGRRVLQVTPIAVPTGADVSLAALVVHTAGTHNSVVTLPGLSPERAAEIREAIRHEIRADVE